jgi:hypothetical protein
MRKTLVIALGLATLSALAAVQPAVASNNKCNTSCVPDYSKPLCPAKLDPRKCFVRYEKKCVTTCSGIQGPGGPAPSISDPKLKPL